ncbi:MAG: hypothetical protein WA996_10935, partial [Candidatus Promineifilaceae bacterium]
LSVSLEELIGDPTAFVGDHLQLAGDLYRAPLSSCNSKERLFPANWILSDGDLEIPVSNKSQELRQLGANVSDIVLAGRWLYWQGLVGCGRKAEVAEQWYLDVDRIVSPNPVALVPVLSVSPVGDLVDSGPQPVLPETGVPPGSHTPSAPNEVDGQFTGTTTPIPQQNTMTQTADAVTTTVASATPSITPTPEPDQGSILPTTTPTQEVPDLLDTATPADPPSLPTATETVDNPPVATATESPLQTIFRMALDISSIETGRLGNNEIHRWTHEITSTKQLTVSLASDHLLDLSVSIVDAGGRVIAQQNAAINGEPEILGGVTLIDPGIYDILVSSPTGEPGYYAILISDDESYPYFFQGTLLIDDIGNAVIARDSDHFWHFTGTAGQAISISVVPAGDSDLFLNLFGTDGVSLIRFHDETASGEPEQIIGYVLPDTGIYSLRIGELNFGSAEYEIFLTDG